METDMTLSEFPAFADNNGALSSYAMRYIEKCASYTCEIISALLLNDITLGPRTIERTNICDVKMERGKLSRHIPLRNYIAI